LLIKKKEMFYHLSFSQKGGTMRKNKDPLKGLLVRDHMQPVPIVVHEDETIHQALSSLRQQKYEGKILYFYVVDSRNRLLGVVSARSLLLADPHSNVREVMEDSLFCLKEEEEFEKAMEKLSHHRLLALPVVDHDNELKGIFDIQVCLEENIDLFKARRDQDIFHLVGMRLEEGVHKNPVRSYKKRMPWILCNVGGGLACAAVSSFFHLVLAKMLVLAMFIPLILSLSESISMQAMTQSLQTLRSVRASKKKIFLQMLMEMRIAVWMSLTSGILVGVLSLLWKVQLLVAASIAVGILVSVTISAVVGTTIPILLHARKLDPKVASGPVVLTLADVLTTALYLSLATWWLL
jgi:magnesium transporter